jgi:hypothetical protein
VKAWRHWSPRATRILRRLYPRRPLEEIAKRLRRSTSAVKNHAVVLGVRRKTGRRFWLPEEEKRLRQLYPDTPGKEIAATFKRPLVHVYAKAKRLGLEKSAAFKASPAACRLRRGDDVGAAFRFRPGHVPANKGLRRPGYARTHGRMAETTFKKGQMPHNHLPVGSVIQTADGYVRRKIADLPNNGIGSHSKNWEFVHRRVWEDAHGPIPKGHRIWWKDRNHLNCKLKNLELLTDKDHMARTTIHTLPPALKEVLFLKGALTRKIRRMEEHARARTEARNEEHDHRPAQPPLRDARSAAGRRGPDGDRAGKGHREGRGRRDRLGQSRAAVPRADRAGIKKRVPRARQA